MVTAGATANTTEGNSRASRESGLLCPHSHGESIAGEGGVSGLSSRRGEQGGVGWPIQDIRLRRDCCARIDHPFIPPARLHCPPWCNTIARLLDSIRVPFRPRVCMLYTILLVITISCKGQGVGGAARLGPLDVLDHHGEGQDQSEVVICGCRHRRAPHVYVCICIYIRICTCIYIYTYIHIYVCM